ncbi:Pre-mRNA-splicing factor 18 [Holothuria leucospilota]|uniref:Pre-mRNA-splicing factor 18 n=1 Tax=Holothuria leucospilota TaxID=206669 RepID=A0A9Q1CL75_HOLLE|nr:Pre-mRNA-splicing factor 18 [Holothuria leucospilota]
MDFLKAEIARKKRQLETDVSSSASKKNFFKRGDLIAKQKEDYFKRQKRDDSKDQTDEGGNSRKRIDSTDQDNKEVTYSRQEVIRRLRERGEPIRLFGETNSEAFYRLRRIEMLAPEINKGLRNDFKDAMDKVDQQYLEEMVKGHGEDEHTKAYDIKLHEEGGTTLEELVELSRQVGTEETDNELIIKFIRFVQRKWAEDLNSRETENKRNMKGKLQTATYSQTSSYLEPLVRKLKKKNLSPDLLDSLVQIVKFMLEREYVKANDAYLQMAIGNAPWPIGVTMVGIHARTGREKIFSKNVAHVLNDETQRKYIQGLKRLMTICQRLFPTDPSKSVEYGA